MLPLTKKYFYARNVETVHRVVPTIAIAGQQCEWLKDINSKVHREIFFQNYDKLRNLISINGNSGTEAIIAWSLGGKESKNCSGEFY